MAARLLPIEERIGFRGLEMCERERVLGFVMVLNILNYDRITLFFYYIIYFYFSCFRLMTVAQRENSRKNQGFARTGP